MNPYTQGVIDVAKRQAVNDAQGTFNQINRDAASAGAFGGSRQAVLQGQAYNNLDQRLSDIQQTGMQQNFSQAMDNYFKGQGVSQNLIQQGLNSQTQGLNFLTDLGKTTRAIDQANLDVDYQNWLQSAGNPTNQLNTLGSLIQNVAPYYTNFATGQKDSRILKDTWNNFKYCWYCCYFCSSSNVR